MRLYCAWSRSRKSKERRKSVEKRACVVHRRIVRNFSLLLPGQKSNSAIRQDGELTNSPQKLITFLSTNVSEGKRERGSLKITDITCQTETHDDRRDIVNGTNTKLTNKKTQDASDPVRICNRPMKANAFIDLKHGLRHAKEIANRYARSSSAAQEFGGGNSPENSSGTRDFRYILHYVHASRLIGSDLFIPKYLPVERSR